MRPLVAARKVFDGRLKALGFAPSPSLPLSYSRPAADGLVQTVDIEKSGYFNLLYFTLAEHDPQGVPVRSINLCDFEDLPTLSYTDQQSLSAVVQAAFHQFVTYGERWLNGEDVVTPAIAKRREAHRQFTYERLTLEARVLFKAGSLPAAITKFAEAEVYGPLDTVSRKMRDIALARIDGA